MVAIFVLAVFFSIISVDLIVLKFQGKNHPAFEPSFSQYSFVDRASIAIPSNLFISKGHTWIKDNMKGLVDIGVDEFGTMAMGKLSFLKCADVGKELKRGEVIFECSYGDKIVKFLSPVNGIVKSANTNIIGKNISNPYETWGVQLLSKDFVQNQNLLLSGREALSWMKLEFNKLKNFIDSHITKVELAGETMYDGGTLSDNILSSLVDQSVNDFEKEFLSL